MKNILMLLILTTILSCSCNKKATENDVVTNEFVKINSVVKTKWRLIELNGNVIENENFYIEFTNENTFSAFAGCNAMGGEYKIEEGNKIQFSKVMSTLMACQDMETEQQLAKVFEIADNFNLNTNSLSLNKAKMAPLARFELMK